MSGRFLIKRDVASINRGLKERQGEIGTTVLWYPFDRETTDADFVDDVYDEESTTSEFDWKRPFRLPVIHALRTEGPEQRTDTGFYTTDRVHLTVSYEQARRHGLTDLDLKSNERLHDRFVYDNVVFQVTSIQVLGQLEDRDVIVAIDADEVDPSELRNSEDFSRWAR